MSIQQHTISTEALGDSEFIVRSKCTLRQPHPEDIGLFCQLTMNIARGLARRLQGMNELLI